jgi:hypothetical protein
MRCGLPADDLPTERQQSPAPNALFWDSLVPFRFILFAVFSLVFMLDLASFALGRRSRPSLARGQTVHIGGSSPIVFAFST